ncbi:MAG: hypothetical protein KDA85_12750 [Planctomycetaceae bacterium]|nr:hypothetical protein [Planctomycetaceae bacterium]
MAPPILRHPVTALTLLLLLAANTATPVCAGIGMEQKSALAANSMVHSEGRWEWIDDADHGSSTASSSHSDQNADDENGSSDKDSDDQTTGTSGTGTSGTGTSGTGTSGTGVITIHHDSDDGNGHHDNDDGPGHVEHEHGGHDD